MNKLEKGNIRKKCQKFTPPWMVEKMLDLANYKRNIVGKKVLESSFGSGNFLESIVSRYIRDGESRGLSRAEIGFGLANDIYGFEIDKSLYLSTLERLNVLAKKHGIESVNWNLKCADFLLWNADVCFDFAIGNPPYLNYRDIKEKDRKYIRANFDTCRDGKYDYCYAFLEKEYKMLVNNGIMVQLIPANIYKNVYADKLRSLIKNDIENILEFPNEKIFSGTGTVSSIIRLRKNNKNRNLTYKDSSSGEKIVIKKKSLGDKWTFNSSNRDDVAVLFGDYFSASIAVATQLNSTFVVDREIIRENKLEKSSYRLAASPKGIKYNRKEFIIFPYYYRDDRLHKYEEYDFRQKFPHTYQYLFNKKKDLDGRKKDKNAKWFEYGRSQALNHLNQDKLLLSTIITKEVKPYHLGTDTIPYAGIYITVLDRRYSLDDAYNILTSKTFLEYVNQIGTCINGNSKRITCVDIKNFNITEWIHERA